MFNKLASRPVRNAVSISNIFGKCVYSIGVQLFAFVSVSRQSLKLNASMNHGGRWWIILCSVMMDVQICGTVKVLLFVRHFSTMKVD
jgi:hypothetical protein